MKYKKNDKLKSSTYTLEIQGIIGEVYICIVSDSGINSAACYANDELDRNGYTLVIPEIPKDQVEIKVMVCDGTYEVKVSSGKLNEGGGLMCYYDGKYEGRCMPWANWEVICK